MRSIFFILFLFISPKIFCQDTVITKMIVFDQEDMSQYSSEKSGIYKKNALKINPLLIVNGEIPIYYERSLNKHFALEAAIGITFKNYLGDFLDELDDEFNSFDNEEILSNPSFKLGLRYYTEGVGLDGFYFSVEYAKRKYSSSVLLVPGVPAFKEETSINEFKLIVGNQEHNYWDSFFIDYYAGVGVRNQNISEVGETFGNVRGYTINKRDKSGPALYLGLKVGFEF